MVLIFFQTYNALAGDICATFDFFKKQKFKREMNLKDNSLPK